MFNDFLGVQTVYHIKEGWKHLKTNSEKEIQKFLLSEGS